MSQGVMHLYTLKGVLKNEIVMMGISFQVFINYFPQIDLYGSKYEKYGGLCKKNNVGTIGIQT